MQIVLVTNDPELKEYRNRELAERLQRRGAALIPLGPGSEIVTTGNGEITIRCQQDRVLQPTLVINGLTSKTGKGLYLVRMLEAAGFETVNRAEPWYWAKYKPIATNALVAHGIPHPPTLFARGFPDGLPRLARSMARRIVLKPWNGALGRGIIRLKNGKSLRLRLRRWYERHGTVYAQNYVPSPKGRDIRALVIGSRVFGATYRYPAAGSWITNVTSGGHPANCPVTPDIASLALRAARALQLDIAGVDLIESRTGLQVLEVNAWPNYLLYDRLVGIDIADQLAAYLYARAAATLRR